MVHCVAYYIVRHMVYGTVYDMISSRADIKFRLGAHQYSMYVSAAHQIPEPI